MGFLRNNILNEVAGYYSKMLLTEAKVSDVINSVCNAHPEVNPEELYNYISQCETASQSARGETYANAYTLYIANMYVSGQLDGVSPEEVDDIIKWYDDNKKNIPNTSKPKFKGEGITPFRDLIALRANLAANADNEAQMNNEDRTSSRLRQQDEEIMAQPEAESSPHLQYVVDMALATKYPDYQPRQQHPEETLDYEDEDWIIAHPETYPASRRMCGDEFGRPSGWCTGNSEHYWNLYRTDRRYQPNNMPYYQIYSKKHPGKRWQIHPESGQFFAPNDSAATFGDMAGDGNVHSVISFLKSKGKNLDQTNEMPPRPDHRHWMQGVPQRELIPVEEIGNALRNPEVDLLTLFDEISDLSQSEGKLVKRGGRCNVMKPNRTLLMPGVITKWATEIKDNGRGLSIVKTDKRKKNILRNREMNFVLDIRDTNQWMINVAVSDDGKIGKLTQQVAKVDANGELERDEQGHPMPINKYNIVNISNGALACPGNKNEWFDAVGNYNNGVAAVKKIINGQPKYNFVNSDSGLLFNIPTENWFDAIAPKTDGTSIVQIGEKYNMVKPDGSFLYNASVEEWFDWISNETIDEYVMVGIDDGEVFKRNLIGPNGFIWNHPVNEWFDEIGYLKNEEATNTDEQERVARFSQDFIKVVIYVNDYDKENLLHKSGQLAYNKPPEQWFDRITPPYSGYSLVANYHDGVERANILMLDGSNRLVLEGDWFEGCGLANNGRFPVQYHGRMYFVDANCNFYTEDGRPIQSPVENRTAISETRRRKNLCEDAVNRTVQRIIQEKLRRM